MGGSATNDEPRRLCDRGRRWRLQAETLSADWYEHPGSGSSHCRGRGPPFGDTGGLWLIDLFDGLFRAPEKINISFHSETSSDVESYLGFEHSDQFIDCR